MKSDDPEDSSDISHFPGEITRHDTTERFLDRAHKYPLISPVFHAGNRFSVRFLLLSRVSEPLRGIRFSPPP